MFNRETILKNLNAENYYIDKHSLDLFLNDWKIDSIYEDDGGLEFYDELALQNNLIQELNLLKSAMQQVKAGNSIAKGLKNNLVRYKSANADILKDLKKLVQNYISLTVEFTSKSALFDFITISNKIDIDYEMKMTTDFNYSAVMNLCTKLFKFYNIVEARVEEIEGLINESIDTKG